MEEKGQEAPTSPLGGSWASARPSQAHVSLSSHGPKGFQKPHFFPASSIYVNVPYLGLLVTSALHDFTPGASCKRKLVQFWLIPV